VFDELLLEAPEAEVPAAREVLREEMCAAYPLDPLLRANVGVGYDRNQPKS
jgi:DNA polymerase I-like protein with 3'-5' exonuclease and polymerase domains